MPDVLDGVAALAQRPDLVQPPQDVASAIASGKPRVAAHGEGDLAAGPLNFVSDLHSARGGADDEDAASRQLFRTSIRRSRDLQNGRWDSAAGSRNKGQVTVSRCHDHRRSGPLAAVGDNAKAISSSLDALYSRFRHDWRRGRRCI